MSSLERSNESDADHSNQTIETFIQDYFPGWFQNRDEATPQNKRWGVYLQAPTPHLQLPTGLRKSLRCDVGAASSNRTAAHQSRNQYLASLNGREMGQGSNRMELDSGESTQLVLDILMNGRPPDTNQVTDKVPTSETGDSSCAESWVDIDDEDFDANTARIENWLRGTRAALPDIDQAFQEARDITTKAGLGRKIRCRRCKRVAHDTTPLMYHIHNHNMDAAADDFENGEVLRSSDTAHHEDYSRDNALSTHGQKTRRLSNFRKTVAKIVFWPFIAGRGLPASSIPSERT